jgi:pimeloyl-ACP methyl ester carboxylesterase
VAVGIEGDPILRVTMPTVERPDGAEIHWERQGRGPLVLVAHQILWSYPTVYADLIGDLARDHLVVTYDPRGCGRSSRRGPYDAETDAADLRAVAEATRGQALALAVGYGYNLAARVATERRDLISHVLSVTPAAATMLPRSELKDSGLMGASDSVIEMVMTMFESDPRTALRAIIAATNPELDEDALRDRVDRASDYISAEAGFERVQTWLQDDTSDQTRALGDRLWIVHGEAEPLFEGALGARVTELYPEAHIEQLPGGPISRPDLFAARIRRLTRP